MSYETFRAELDSVLRTQNPAALRTFLIAQGQWPEDTTIDAERALWMMIAGSPSLQPLHDQAQDWLIRHGYHEEAKALREPNRNVPPKSPAKEAHPPKHSFSPRPRRRR